LVGRRGTKQTGGRRTLIGKIQVIVDSLKISRRKRAEVCKKEFEETKKDNLKEGS